MATDHKYPYQTGPLDGAVKHDLDPSQQMRQFKAEDEDAKADLILPYEMSQLPQYFAEMVDNGFQAGKTLEALISSENFDNRKDLLKLKNNVDKMVMYLVKTVDPLLSKYTIGRGGNEFEKKTS